MPADRRTLSGQELGGWYRFSGELLALSILVQPGAHRTEVSGRHGDMLRIRLAAVAADDRANIALIGFLSRSLGVPPSRIFIRMGRHARRKVVELEATGPGARSVLTEWDKG